MSKVERWNLSQEVKEYGGNTFTDFSGMYGKEVYEFVVNKVLENTRHYDYLIDGEPQPRFKELLRDLVANQLLSHVEVIGIDEHTDEEWDIVTLYIVETINSLLTSEWWTKSGVDWESEDKKYREARERRVRDDS